MLVSRFRSLCRARSLLPSLAVLGQKAPRTQTVCRRAPAAVLICPRSQVRSNGRNSELSDDIERLVFGPRFVFLAQGQVQFQNVDEIDADQASQRGFFFLLQQRFYFL